MKPGFLFFTAFFFSSFILSTAQTDTLRTKEFLKAFNALHKKDTTSAITLFKESIKQNGDASSYFVLAKLSLGKKTITELNNAKDYVDEALDIDPNNIDYLLLRAYIWEERFWTERQYFIGRTKAINIYERILEIDNNNAEALYNLGRLNVEEFIEYQNAAVKIGINKAINPIKRALKYRGRSSLRDDTQNDFENSKGNFPEAKLIRIAYTYYSKARNSLEKSIEHNSRLAESYTELSKLYITAGEFEKAIELLSPLTISDRLNKDAHLSLGLAYHRINDDSKASVEFQNAISLMNKQEKNDFTINSVKLLLFSRLGDNVYGMTEAQLLPYISDYWGTNDPLILTPYNERLLEHYSRVTYADFFLGSRRLKIEGWNTDRGEVLLRYGFPKETMRYITETEMDVITDKPRTEVWDYGNMAFSFVDADRNRSYRFAQPWNSMLSMDTQEDIINLRQTKPEEYIPSFKGAIFDLSYKTYQFASSNSGKTDVYLSYNIDYSDTSTTMEKFSEGYDVGLFLFDNGFNKKFDYKKTYTSVDQARNNLVNSLEMTLLPQSGNLAFEMLRKKDKGVSSYHGKFNVRGFSNSDLGISDVVLASSIETDQKLNGAIERNNISILPNPTKAFGKKDKLYLYYEIYNLTKNTNSTTDFEQKITIQEKEEGGVVNSLLSIVGLDKEGKKVALTSKYQTREKDPQMYLQLDMSKYEPGEYIITVSIKDNAAGKEVNSQTEINWR